MDPGFAKLLNAALSTAVGVAAGSLPLMGMIGWFVMQQSHRMNGIDMALDKFAGANNRLTEAVGEVKTAVAVLADEVARP